MNRCTSAVKIWICGLLIAGFAFTAAWSQDKKEKKPKAEKSKKAKGPKLVTFQDSASYALGVVISETFRMQLLDSLNIDVLTQALKAQYSGQPTLMTSEQADQVLQAMNTRQQAGAEARRRDELEKSNNEAKAWLAKNKNEPGVVEMENGLQYKVIKEGSGAKPSLSSEVTVHYTGTLIDGKKFDSSYDRNMPATFPLNGVIPGWQHGLQLMSPGSKYMLFIPPDMGYGPTGAGKSIPPNAVLIFEVELISFK